MANQDSWRRPALGPGHGERMIAPDQQCVAAVESEPDPAVRAGAFVPHFYDSKGRAFDVDHQLLDWGDKHMPAVSLAPEDGRK